MTTWKLSPQYKKSAVEKMFFYKDGKVIIMEQGFRWATFTVESDERPLTDLELINTDGYELGCIANDECWEMQEMMDGCWLDISIGNDKTTSADEEEFSEAWEEDSYEAVEALGWSQDDTEYYYHGPLELTNEDTGEVFQGEPDQPQEKTEEQLLAELNELIATMPEIHVTNTDDLVDFPVTTEENSGVTDWFPKDINPARTGTYEVINEGSSAAWPFPYSVTTAEWDGIDWNSTVKNWRGLSYDPAR
jgi:hypothetical protein